MRNVLLRGLLVVAVVIPVTLANATPARAAWYWSGYQHDYVYQWWGCCMLYQSDVTYQLGYDYSGYPSEIIVSRIRDTLQFYQSPSYAYHENTLAAVVKSTCWECSQTVWTDYSRPSCSGTCTLVRDRSMWVWLPYNSTAAVYELYNGASWAGVGKCEVFHQFAIHRLESWCGY